MAIIKGMKTADMGSITPYNEDIEKLAAGVMAREGRAEETRNAIADARNQMLLKETRDNSEDMALAQKLEQGFTSDVDSMLDKADADYSMISKGDLQRLAGDYMGKTEWRALTNAKIQTDIYNDEKRKLEAAGGSATIFGKDPNKVSLYDEEGNINHLTGTFEVQKTLDHSQAAKDLFDTLGHKLKKETGYDEVRDGKDFIKYYNSWIETHKDNRPMVDEIILGGIDGFLTDPEGLQYYRIHYESQRDLGIDHETADKYAREKVVALVRTYGKSEYIYEDTRTDTRNDINTGKGATSNPRKPGSIEAEPIGETHPTTTATVSYHSFNSPEGQDAIDVLLNNTEGTNFEQIGQGTEVAKISDITNNNTLIEVIGAVHPVNDSNGKGSGGDGVIYKPGTLFKLGQKEGERNPTVFSINTIQNINGAIEIIDDEITIKNEEIQQNPSNEAFKTDLKNLEIKKFKQKLRVANKENYKNLDFETLKGYTSENISDLVGDDLFTTTDIRKLLEEDDTILKNASMLSEQVYKSILNSENTNSNWKSGSITTYQTENKDGDINININSVLTKLQEKYKTDLESLYDEDDEGNKTLKSSSSKGEEKLLEAKIFKIAQKIRLAKEFLDKNDGVVENIKTTFNKNFTSNKNLRIVLDQLAINAGLTTDQISKGLHLKLPEYLDDTGKKINTYNGKHELATERAEIDSGIDWTDPTYGGTAYNAFESTKETIKVDFDRLTAARKERQQKLKERRNKRVTIGDIGDTSWSLVNRLEAKLGKNATKDETLRDIQKIKDAHLIFRNNITTGKYTEEDLKETDWYEKYIVGKKYKLENMHDEYTLASSQRAYMLELNQELLKKEFEKAKISNNNSYTIELMNTLLMNNTGTASRVSAHALGAGLGYYDSESRTYSLKPEVTTKIYKNKKKQLQVMYGPDPKLKAYFKSVDELSQQINRTSEYYVFEVGGNGESKSKYDHIKRSIVASYKDQKIRRVIYDNSDGSKMKEALNKQDVQKQIDADYNVKYPNGGFEADEYKKQWLEKKLTGIRLDYTNPGGPMFVAQFEYGDGTTSKTFEMNTTTIDEKTATEYFGISGLQMKYTDYLSKGLIKNNGLWADLPTIGGGNPIRVHQALTSFTGSGGDGNKVIRGNFYVMSDKSKMYEDKNEGSTKYGMDATDVFYHQFETMNEVFTYVKNKSSDKMKHIDKLLKQKAALENTKYASQSISEILGVPAGKEYHPYEESWGNKSDAIKGIDDALQYFYTGIDPTKPNIATGTTSTAGTTAGTTANKLPQSFQLPGS